MAQLISAVDQLSFSLRDISSMSLPGDALFVRPLHYSVDYVINLHMADKVGQVDRRKAYQQWETVGKLFERLGLNSHVILDHDGLPDMVFCANQSLPFIDENGQREVFMSNMFADERKDEVPYIEQWYRRQGFALHFLDDSINFEGCGDALWHPGKRLLWGGYGQRTSPEAYERISEIFDVSVITLQLTDDSFYHLDTCLCLLDETTALAYPEAFTDQGWELITTLFDNVIEASKEEANRFACNASCPDGKNVIIQQGCSKVNQQLREAGFEIHEVDTGEFLKSGGSVFCMKQFFWSGKSEK